MLFLIFVSGFFAGVLFIIMVLRWGWRHKELLTQLLQEVYHEDLLNYTSRIKGLLQAAMMEYDLSPARSILIYVDKALIEIDALDAGIRKTAKKYQDFQYKNTPR